MKLNSIFPLILFLSLFLNQAALALPKSMLGNLSNDSVYRLIKKEQIVSFDYPNADIAEVGHAFALLLKRKLLIDANVKCRINLPQDRPRTFEKTLIRFLKFAKRSGCNVVFTGNKIEIYEKN